MAKTSELPAAAALTGSELVAVVQDDELRAAPVSDLRGGVSEYAFMLDAADDPEPGAVNLAISIPAGGTLSRVYSSVEEGIGSAEVALLVNGESVFAASEVTDAAPLDEAPNVTVVVGDTITALVPTRDATITVLFIKVEVSL